MIANDNNQPGLTISSPLFFKHDENIDYETLSRYLSDVCSNKHVAAVYSMAYNTRYRMLTDAEVLEVNRFIIEKVHSEGKKVYVGHPYVFSRESLSIYFEEISKLPVNGVSMLYPERYFGVDEPIIEFLKFPLKYGLKTVLHEMKLVSGFDGELINWPDTLLNRVFNEVDLAAVKEDSKDDQVTDAVLNLCNKHDVHCVLAGGGKIRAERFISKGLKTWLNGSTMFLPNLIDEVYIAFINKDENYKSWYVNNVESPFFNQVVTKYGWHLAHKAALEFFGYGTRLERFPHASMLKSDFEIVKKTLEEIRCSVEKK